MDNEGFTTHQNMMEKISSKAKYGNIKPKKPMNHQVDGLRYGARQDNKNKNAIIALITINKRFKKLRATEPAML